MKKVFLTFAIFAAGVLVGRAISHNSTNVDLPEEYKAIESGDLLIADSVSNNYIGLSFVKYYQIAQLPEYYDEHIETDLFYIDSIAGGIVYMNYYTDSTCVQNVDFTVYESNVVILSDSLNNPYISY